MTTYLSYDPVLDEDGFIGRQADLDWLIRMLQRPSPQNCNLIGEPRIGKTSLLYQVKARRIGAAAEGKCIHVWLRLAELPDRQPVSFWRAMWTQFHGAVKEVGLSVEGSAAAPDEARDLFDEVDEAI
ncbi:MAG: hypothetical protein GY796_10135, partial [Chloroflexi bacterium]|nr:hypothetical protein [Chloroflexota bacterium]